MEIPSHLSRWVIISLWYPRFWKLRRGTMSSMIPSVYFSGEGFFLSLGTPYVKTMKKLTRKLLFCRSAKAASSHYRLECLCKCKETCRWWLCPIYLVCSFFQHSKWSLGSPLFLMSLAQRFSPVKFVHLLEFSGMTTISFFWEFAGQLGRKLSCHLLSYLVIACTLVFLLQLLMLLQQIAGLLSFITQGRFF